MKNCEWCSTEFRSHPGGTPQRFCTKACKTLARDLRRKPKVLARKAARYREYVATHGRPPGKPKARRPRPVFADRVCADCDAVYTPSRSDRKYCSPRCVRRAGDRRRRGREYNTVAEWRWSDFMRLAAVFGYCCAYCGEKPLQLEPDHVVPLARGGANSTTNLLPACRECNISKQALLPDEWAARLERDDRPPRRTSWSADDSRYWHLTESRLAA